MVTLRETQQFPSTEEAKQAIGNVKNKKKKSMSTCTQERIWSVQYRFQEKKEDKSEYIKPD